METEVRLQPELQPETDEEIPIPRVPKKKMSGFLYHYGPQAWIDMVMSKTMLVERALPLVGYTFVPILRMVSDPEKIDREYAEIRSRREKLRFFDSPRERWRKRYGNFVREAEWALLELRKHFTKAQYEDIAAGTSASLAKEGSTGFLDMMNSVADRKPPKKKPGSEASTQPSRMQKLMFDMFNPAGFLTGPGEITEYDPAGGLMVMEIPDCAWHICAAAESLPNPNALPEEGCLQICKGSFERLFDGKDGGLRVEFDAHLPETSCTVRMSWRGVGKQ